MRYLLLALLIGCSLNVDSKEINQKEEPPKPRNCYTVEDYNNFNVLRCEESDAVCFIYSEMGPRGGISCLSKHK